MDADVGAGVVWREGIDEGVRETAGDAVRDDVRTGGTTEARDAAMASALSGVECRLFPVSSGKEGMAGGLSLVDGDEDSD